MENEGPEPGVTPF